eukprot:7378774-Prymnesium_polylepis.4
MIILRGNANVAPGGMVELAQAIRLANVHSETISSLVHLRRVPARAWLARLSFRRTSDLRAT